MDEVSGGLVGQGDFLSDYSIELDQGYEARSGDSQFSFSESCLFSPTPADVCELFPEVTVEQTFSSNDEIEMVDTTKHAVASVEVPEEIEEVCLELEPGELFDIKEMSEIPLIKTVETRVEQSTGSMSENTPKTPKPLTQGNRKMKKEKVEFVVVGDSNFDGCENYIPGVLYKRATRYNDLKFRFTNRMNEISQLNDLKVVVISAVQNMIRDAGFADWESTVDKYILTISKTAVRKPTVKFVVFGPFLRTSQPEHRELLEPVLVRLTIGLAAHLNVFINSSFEINEMDLQADGVHLKIVSQRRLFEVIKECFKREWIPKVYSKIPVVQMHDTCTTTTQQASEITSHISLPEESKSVNTSKKQDLPPRSEVHIVGAISRSRSSSSFVDVSSQPTSSRDQNTRAQGNQRSPSPHTVEKYEYYHRKLYGFAPERVPFADYRTFSPISKETAFKKSSKLRQQQKCV